MRIKDEIVCFAHLRWFHNECPRRWAKQKKSSFILLFEYRLCQKKLYNFQFLIAEKVNKAQQQHSGGQKHNFPVFKKFLKWYHSMVRCKSYDLLSDKW